METRKLVKLLLISGLATFLLPAFVSTYSAHSTHPALTDEIIDFFNHEYPELKLPNAEKELIKQGSSEEDKPVLRVLNHFYDPVRNVGLLSANPTSKRWALETQLQDNRKNLAGVGGLFLDYFGGADDYSWERAIFDYVHKDKERGLKALGHILHLIEDTTVPDHVRDDPHLSFLAEEVSPYEKWAKRFTPENFQIVDTLVQENKKPILYGSIEEYFDKVATYANNNFFSKDTILKNRYSKPTVLFEEVKTLSNGEKHLFGYSQVDNKRIPLVRIRKEFNVSANGETRFYFLDDTDNLILSNYWRILSRQAVVNGAGVVKLFFDEVEKERETLALLEKNRSPLAKLLKKAKENFASAFSSSGTSVVNTAALPAAAVITVSNLARNGAETEEVEVAPATRSSLAVSENSSSQRVANRRENPPVRTLPAAAAAAPQAPTRSSPATQSSSPELGVAGQAGDSSTPLDRGDTATTTPTPDVPPQASPTTPESPPLAQVVERSSLQGTAGGDAGQTAPVIRRSGRSVADTTAPSAPSITSPANGATLTATGVTFSGTAEASSIISNDFSSATATAAAEGGGWNLSFTLLQGTTTIQFYATDAAGNRSAATSTTVFVDSNAPDLSFTSAACNQTISSDACLVATTTLSWTWNSSASDIAYFTLDENGTVSTTTGTTRTTLASLNSSGQGTYTFKLSATDRSGNTSATTTQSVEVNTRPVVINEIAWAGTNASSFDEWIELYNRTSRSVSLASFTLYASDLSPYIPLSGTVSAGGYFLIERTDDTTVNDTAADLIKPFSGEGGSGLNNSGETMMLAYKSSGQATTTIDETFTCNNWCNKGDDALFTTMERYDAAVVGTDLSNWYSHPGYIRNGKDANNTNISGTPRAKNAISYFIAPSGSLSANKTLTAANSPYLVAGSGASGLTVGTGVTLTIEAGTVVKITSNNEPWIRVQGTFVANGTAASPVVFTSFYDDEYGGDMNNDGSVTTPAAGNWRRLLFESTSAGSSLSNTIVRYAGNNNISDQTAKQGAVGVDGATVAFNGLVVEKSNFHGLVLENSASTVANSRFSTSTNTEVSSTGLYISGGSPSVSGSAFSGNYRGLHVESATPTVSSNTFTSNSREAVLNSGRIGSFNGNSGSGNGTNAILISSGTLATGGATTTLSKNSTLPYVVQGTATVNENSTLSFEEGVVVKGWDSSGSNYGEISVKEGGKIYSTGDSADDLVFTSIRDGTVGGTTKAGLFAPAAGDWKGINIQKNARVALSGFTLRYAGSQGINGGEGEGGMKITGDTLASGYLSNGLFEQNYQSGLSLKDVIALTLSNLTFKNHTEKSDTPAAGIYSKNSTATLSGVMFSGNETDAKGSGTNSLTCSSCTPASPATSPANLFSP